MPRADDRLLSAVREELARLDIAFEERRMFGGVTMMHAGNMLCCVSPRGLMVRVGAAGEAAALARPHAQPCMGTGRRMPGFIMVELSGVATDRDVAFWLQTAHAYVATLPEKGAKTAPQKRS